VSHLPKAGGILGPGCFRDLPEALIRILEESIDQNIEFIPMTSRSSVSAS